MRQSSTVTKQKFYTALHSETIQIVLITLSNFIRSMSCIRRDYQMCDPYSR